MNNDLKQKKYIKHQNHQIVTNPLHYAKKEYQDLQTLKNRNVILDRVMFVALGVFAIWAFYVSLMSLML